jgi:hypothetical protein
MSRLQNKQCPFYKVECLVTNCAMYDERLDNCAVHLITYNLYKLDMSLKQSMEGTNQKQSKQFPFPSPQ